MAVIGRSRAVAELPGIRLSGFLAWCSWLLIHLIKLVNFQNKLTITAQWGWNYLTRSQSAMLITGDTKLELPQSEDAPSDQKAADPNPLFKPAGSD